MKHRHPYGGGLNRCEPVEGAGHRGLSIFCYTWAMAGLETNVSQLESPFSGLEMAESSGAEGSLTMGVWAKQSCRTTSESTSGHVCPEYDIHEDGGAANREPRSTNLCVVAEGHSPSHMGWTGHAKTGLT